MQFLKRCFALKVLSYEFVIMVIFNYALQEEMNDLIFFNLYIKFKHQHIALKEEFMKMFYKSSRSK